MDAFEPNGTREVLTTELYEFTMADGFYAAGLGETIGCYDLFFRRVPDNGGFAIMAGLQRVIENLQNLHFTEDDLQFLRMQGISEPFLAYLRDFRFACDIWAVPEGTPIFPNEPIVKVRGPVVQAQMIETLLLLCINQQSLIATKANRLVRAARGTAVAEFGARRAQGFRYARTRGCSGASPQ